jgi:cobalt-zinc-cadmium efflux system outer membrane protein
MRRVIALLGILASAGCAARSPYDRIYVSATIEKRTGHSLDPAMKPGEAALPPGVSLEDGLTEDEAVAVALWNNARFRTNLAELALARAGLVEAGLLPNPLVSFLRLFGVKGTEAYVLWPLDALWQRPKKVAAAKFDVERTASRLIQEALNLSRDALVAYADLALAQSVAKIAEDEVRLRDETAAIAAARLRAGDISGLEESAARVEAFRAKESARRAARDVATARTRFAAILGWGELTPNFSLSPGQSPGAAEAALPELLEKAFASRPDLRAAQLEIEAAGARLGWEKSRIVKLTATLESKEKGEAGAFIGPSGKVEIPLFNRNEGGQARARAEMERAAQNYFAVRERISSEVKEASVRLEAGRAALTLLRDQVVPAASEAAVRAKKAYAVGEESYLFALEAERQLLDARRRDAEATAEVRRADAELRRGVGFLKDAPDRGKTEK